MLINPYVYNGGGGGGPISHVLHTTDYGGDLQDTMDAGYDIVTVNGGASELHIEIVLDDYSHGAEFLIHAAKLADPMVVWRFSADTMLGSHPSVRIYARAETPVFTSPGRLELSGEFSSIFVDSDEYGRFDTFTVTGFNGGDKVPVVALDLRVADGSSIYDMPPAVVTTLTLNNLDVSDVYANATQAAPGLAGYIGSSYYGENGMHATYPGANGGVGGSPSFPAESGGWGGDGSNGTALCVENVYLYNTSVVNLRLYSADGGTGGYGGQGGDAVGGYGGNGADGDNVEVDGGDGGAGGAGGSSGSGGNGGTGGAGATPAGVLHVDSTSSVYNFYKTTHGGTGGIGGNPGSALGGEGGIGGAGYAPYGVAGSDGLDGNPGGSGSSGFDGANGNNGGISTWDGSGTVTYEF